MLFIVILAITFFWQKTAKLQQVSYATPYFEALALDKKNAFEIPANLGWQRTSLYLSPNQTIEFIVKGKWKNNGQETGGLGSAYVCAQVIPADQCVEPAPNFPAGALIARVGDQILFAGNGGRFDLRSGGILELRINDGDYGLTDNSGALTVEIQFVLP
ncbi:hypothetical protein MASR2M66_01200 [Chloroflexota bacterium]